MLQSIVPAYKEGYTILQQNVLHALLSNISTDNETAINQLVSNLTCAIQRVFGALDTAVNRSQQLRIEIDQKVADGVAAVSAKEREISGKQGEIQQKTAEIQGIQSQLQTAEQGLVNKQQAVANAENDLRIAQQKVDDARNCLGGKRRRKRFWGSLFQPIRDIVDVVIEKPLCSAINYGGINNAKDARRNAEQQLQNAQQQVNSFRQQLESLQSQKSNLDTQLSQLQAQLRELQAAVVILREVSNSTATINYELKRVVGHISKIWDASAVLHTTIQNLINFESLIIPLNAIYNDLTQGNLLIRMPVDIISNTTLIQVKQSLNKLASVLPQLPLSTLIDNASCATQT